MIARRTPIKRKRATERRGPLRCPGYRQYLRLGICAVPGCWPVDVWSEIIDPAHTVNNGTGSKGPDSSCAPLCRNHHREYDSGRKAFESKYRINMQAIAASHWAAYQGEGKTV